MRPDDICPLCDHGKLVERERSRDLEIDGFAYQVRGLKSSECSDCGGVVTTLEQSRHNKRTMIEARAQAVAERDRVQRLTPADIVRIRKKLGLTQAQAARVFGGGINAFSKYENNEVEPSDGMEKLLRLSDSVSEAAAWLLRRGGVMRAPALSSRCIPGPLLLPTMDFRDHVEKRPAVSSSDVKKSSHSVTDE